MARRLVSYGVLAGCLIALAGCGVFERPQRPAWREATNRACIKSKSVRVTPHVAPRSGIDGPGICGVDRPYYVTALANGTVAVKSRATLNCPMIATLDRWISESVQPAARERFGTQVVEISTMGSYGCRTRNHQRGAKLSEHAFANALDIGAFSLSDGRKLKVVQHWRRGAAQERAFLRDTHAGACKYFRTVLGPGADRNHENHFHIDLAMHGNTSRGLRHYCRPVIKDILPPPRRDNLPDPPFIEPDPEIARRMSPNRSIALTAPLGTLPPRRIQGIPLPRADIPLARERPIDRRTYGRLQPLEPGAPLLLEPSPRGTIVTPGYLRADGVYVPPGRL